MTATSDAIPVPADVIAAIDRLNGHARAHGFGADAIYAYKTYVAMIVLVDGAATARLIRLTTTCIACGGSGLYWDYHPDFKKPCRVCSRSGRRTLHFTETRIGDVVWHHPWEGRIGGGYHLIRALLSPSKIEIRDDGVHIDGQDGPPRLPWHEPEEWSPQRPGARLDADRAATLLNTVEPWIAGSPRHDFGDLYWKRDAALCAMRTYRLDLGSIRGPCYVCGSDDLCEISMGKFDRLLHWSQPFCRVCYDTNKPIWPKRPPPAAITPAIAAWLDQPWRARPVVATLDIRDD